MTVPEDDNVSNDSNDFTEVENGQINSKFISDRESRRSLTNSHLEKRKCDEYIPGTTSLGMSVFNLSNAIMGSGILGLAFALANTGILLFLEAFYTVLFQCLLALCHGFSLFSEDSNSNSSSLWKISNMEQSKRFSCPLPSTTTRVWSTPPLDFLENQDTSDFGDIAVYIFNKSTIDLFQGNRAWYVDGRVLVVMVTFGIILPLCLLKNLGYLGYTSGFSLSCMVFFLIVVIYKKFQIPCMNAEHNSTISANATDMCTPKYVTFNSKTVYALPTIAFAFVCHPSVLPIYSELKDRSQKKMQMVSNISFFAMFVMYFLTAIFGYLTFYEKVQSDLLHKYDIHKGDILILTVRLAVIVAVILTVPVLFFTVRSSLFELAKKTKFHLCRHVLVTIVLLVIINLLVIFIPSMKDIFGVV
ncbi:hypothetical protein STEG23_010833, partial [Scotinomys teguina]